MHPRTAVRKAIQTLLIAGSTAAGDRVYDTRIYPLGADGPVICIYGDDETIARDDIETAGLRKRTVTILVKCIVPAGSKDKTNFGEILDDLANEVEEIIDLNPTLNFTAEAVWLDGTELSLAAEGERILGVASLIYSVQYRG